MESIVGGMRQQCLRSAWVRLNSLKLALAVVAVALLVLHIYVCRQHSYYRATHRALKERILNFQVDGEENKELFESGNVCCSLDTCSSSSQLKDFRFLLSICVMR